MTSDDVLGIGLGFLSYMPCSGGGDDGNELLIVEALRR